jgi:hypothetical protein
VLFLGRSLEEWCLSGGTGGGGCIESHGVGLEDLTGSSKTRIVELGSEEPAAEGVAEMSRMEGIRGSECAGWDGCVCVRFFRGMMLCVRY